MTQRLTAIVSLLLCLGVGTMFVLEALRDNIVFFLIPSDIEEHLADGSLEGQRLRLGGLVVEGSVSHNKDSGEVHFVVTDGKARVAVRYRGLLPDLFREGEGIVATGVLTVLEFSKKSSQKFSKKSSQKSSQRSSESSSQAIPLLDAEQVLAKHDEYYMPRDLEKALKKRNLWRERP